MSEHKKQFRSILRLVGILQVQSWLDEYVREDPPVGPEEVFDEGITRLPGLLDPTKKTYAESVHDFLTEEADSNNVWAPREIGANLGLTGKTVSACLSYLKKKGLVTNERTGIWRVTKKGK